MERTTYGIIGLIIYWPFMAVWTVLKFVFLLLRAVVLIIHRLGRFGWMLVFDRERVHQAPPWAGTTYSASLTFSDGSEMDYGHKHATRDEAEECARITMAGRR